MDRTQGNLPGQIVGRIRDDIASGVLRPGDRIPATRTMAAELGVSRATVVAAYEQLEGEGYVQTSPAGTRVHPAMRPVLAGIAEEVPCTLPPEQRRAPRIDLRPGHPDTSVLASTTWRAAWRQAAAEPPSYVPREGIPRLRELVADHIRRARGVAVDPRRVFITAGSRHGVSAVVAALGHQITVGVEDPTYPSLVGVVRRGGHSVVTDWSGADAVLVTPSHQFPHGHVMPAPERIELVDWARTHNTLVIEEDFDAELRFQGEPLPSLMAISPEVASIGSFAKTLSPALGLGYVVVPPSLIDALRPHLAPVSGLAQVALAHFMAEDGLSRHITRMRSAYRRRRDIALEIFGSHAVPMDGGLNLIVELSSVGEEESVLARAAARGMAVRGFSTYWSSPASRAGIVVGLGGGTEKQLGRWMTQLRDLLPS